MPDAALRIFPDEYVPNAEGADYHRRWVKANPAEASRWAAFRDAVIATGNGAVPVMATKYGKALVAAGKEHMSISRLVGAMTPPYPPPVLPPTPPPVTGIEVDSFTDFQNNNWGEIFLNRWAEGGYSALGYTGTPWAGGGGIYEVSTPHGAGFRFYLDENLVRGSGQGMQIVDWDHFIDEQAYIGKTWRLTGKIMFPAAGNPAGFPPYGDWNVLWEHGPGNPWNNQFGVDAYTNKIYVRSYKAGNPDSRQKASAASAIVYDQWYTIDWQVKFSEGSSGFVKFILDGQTVADWTGPTQPPGSTAPWVQLGFYSGSFGGSNGKTEVWYADLRLDVS